MLIVIVSGKINNIHVQEDKQAKVLEQAHFHI